MPPRDESDGQWRFESVEPPPFESTRIYALTEQTLPVRALHSPLERALILSILALGLGALALLVTSLRGDLRADSWPVAYGPALTEFLAGAGLFWLAMRWSVPGSGERYSRSSVFLGGALLLALVAALAAPHLVATDHPGLCVGSAPGKGLPCAGWEIMVAIPVLLVSLWFILRGAAVSSVLAGALAGLGAGLLSDAAMHLHCPAVDPYHTVTWHLGSVAVLTGMGALLGRVLPKW